MTDVTQTASDPADDLRTLCATFAAGGVTNWAVVYATAERGYREIEALRELVRAADCAWVDFPEDGIRWAGYVDDTGSAEWLPDRLLAVADRARNGSPEEDR